MNKLQMTDANGKEIKLFSGIDALNALDFMMSLNLEHVADDSAEDE